MATEPIKVQKRVAVKCYKAGNMSQHRRDGFITKSSNHKMQNNNKSELLNAKVQCLCNKFVQKQLLLGRYCKVFVPSIAW